MNRCFCGLMLWMGAALTLAAEPPGTFPELCWTESRHIHLWSPDDKTRLMPGGTR